MFIAVLPFGLITNPPEAEFAITDYSNKSSGLRKKAGTDDQIPALIESEVSPKEFRQYWARLIQNFEYC